MNQEEYTQKMAQVLGKCWENEGFKRKLLADPAATLKAEGVELPAGVSIKAHENTDKEVHLVIPPRPDELSDEDLEKVAGGAYGAGEKNSENYIKNFAKIMYIWLSAP